MIPTRMTSQDIASGTSSVRVVFKLNDISKRFFYIISIFCSVFVFVNNGAAQTKPVFTINLKGEWRFQIDSLDKGIAEKWFSKNLADKISLPGSMTTNGKGNDITTTTRWTGSIFDSSWFFKPEYAMFREPGNIKIPFWLQPIKYYSGAAWYQKTINIPASWDQKHIELFIERSHWETTVWVDGKEAGMQNSLSTAQVFDLSRFLIPGTHQLTIRIDNRIKEVNVGQNSHSISDHTQSNWNGMIGKLLLSARPQVYINTVQLYPDAQKKQVVAKISLGNSSSKTQKANLRLQAEFVNKKLRSYYKEIEVSAGASEIELIYPMNDGVLLWDEFHPNVYKMEVAVLNDGISDKKSESFGFRNFTTKATRFVINDRVTFLRGTLECAIFPLTGFPPTDTSAWMRIYRIVKSYGLNHMRFHSWCPPEAAFEAADRAGVYLQVECSSWPNWGTALGDGAPVDTYIFEESERIVNDYGNHPSFVMLTHGNEPAGKRLVEYLTEFVNHWKKKDNRRLYTSGSGWPSIPANEYQVISEPRIQLWSAGLKSVINREPPRLNYDWRDTIAKFNMPVVSHEIGQWCVYPDFKEINKYKGVLKAKNFEIFQHTLAQHGMSQLADSFLLASGKLQTLCYKADIEAALRTPGFGGFQLLDLHDFPGQGTALVGVFNPFWEEKGYVTGKAYRMFCNATVPLARFPKMIYLNNEELMVPVEIAHFGSEAINNTTPSWTIKNTSGKILFNGRLSPTAIPLGNNIQLGEIKQLLTQVTIPSKLILTVSVNGHQNAWDFFVYPASIPKTGEDILITQTLNEAAIEQLNNGGKVLVTLKKGTLRPDKGGNIAIGFSSIFWNTAWTNGQAPHTLGVLVNPGHPAFKNFPTDYHSNWQWWDAMSHSSAIHLDSVSKNLQPIIRVIDDWVTARPLGLLFECKVGRGKLIFSSIDLLAEREKRPEAAQLLYSLKKYMDSKAFNPKTNVDIRRLQELSR